MELYSLSLFHDHGLKVVELESELIVHGPFSTSNPSMEELPGPPFIHMESGAFAGSFRASKNQKKVLIGYDWFTCRSESAPGGKCT